MIVKEKLFVFRPRRSGSQIAKCFSNRVFLRFCLRKKSCKKHLILCGFGKAYFFAYDLLSLHVCLFYSSPAHCISERYQDSFTRLCTWLGSFHFAVCFLSSVQTSSDIFAVSMSFIEALNAYEVSGCGFNPNKRSYNFKIGPFRGQNDCLFVVFGQGFAILKSCRVI